MPYWQYLFTPLLFVYLAFYGLTLVQPFISLGQAFMDNALRAKLLSATIIQAAAHSFSLSLFISSLFYLPLVGLTFIVLNYPKTKTTLLQLLPLSLSFCYLGYRGLTMFLNFRYLDYFGLIFGYFILYLPSLMRLNFFDEIEKNRTIYYFARLLDDSHYAISFRAISWLLRPFWLRLIQVAALWIFFDYSWIQFFSHSKITSLAANTQALFSSYHRPVAEALLGLMLILSGFIIFLIHAALLFFKFLTKKISQL